MVLLTTYLNCGCAEDGLSDAGVVSDSRLPRMVLMIVVFQSSVAAWLYAETEERAFSHAYTNGQPLLTD